MAENGDVTKLRRTMWDVTWNSATLGYVDRVSPEMELLLDPIKVGSLGKVKLGDRYVGMADGAKVTVRVRECTRAQIAALVPWGTQAGLTGAQFTPPPNTDLYTYAQALTLHPRDMALLNEDLVFGKAVPIGAMDISRDGQSDDAWDITFMIYPDRTQLPKLVYGAMPPVL